jgi:hypothetical protein
MLYVTRRGGGRVLLQIEAIFFLLAGTSSLLCSVTKKINDKFYIGKQKLY